MYNTHVIKLMPRLADSLVSPPFPGCHKALLPDRHSFARALNSKLESTLETPSIQW